MRTSSFINIFDKLIIIIIIIIHTLLYKNVYVITLVINLMFTCSVLIVYLLD